MKHMTIREMRAHYASHGSDLATASEKTLETIQTRRNRKSGPERISDLELKRYFLSSAPFKKLGKKLGNRLARRTGEDEAKKVCRNKKNLIEG